MGSVEYFDKVAEDWDKMRTAFFSENVRVHAYERAKVLAGKMAVDLGAGTGFISEGLLSRGLKVIAVDQSEEMVKILKERYSEIVALKGDAENLPIENNSVDYVFANMYLHHVENPAKAIKEVARIIKPGGKLIITDLDSHNYEFLKTEQFDRWMGFDRYDIIKWFTEAEFKNITVDCTGENCSADSKCGSDYAKVTIFLAYGER